MAKIGKSQPDRKERTSLYLAPDTMRGLKYIAFMDEKTQTDIIEEALSEYISKWEKKRGPVPKKE